MDGRRNVVNMAMFCTEHGEDSGGQYSTTVDCQVFGGGGDRWWWADSGVHAFGVEGLAWFASLWRSLRGQKMFAAFPEVLFVDASYKLNELLMPVYILIVEGGNGYSKIVAFRFWLVASEDRTTIKQMTDLGVRHNPCANQVHYTVIRKDQGNRKKAETYRKDAQRLTTAGRAFRTNPQTKTRRRLQNFSTSSELTRTRTFHHALVGSVREKVLMYSRRTNGWCLVPSSAGSSRSIASSINSNNWAEWRWWISQWTEA